MGLEDRKPPTPEEYAGYRERFSNWGRWGPDDELGTLNFITPAVRRVAAGLVREGRTLSLARPIDTHAGPANPYPAHHFIGVGRSGGLADYIGLFFHGFVQTHLDALSHIATADGRHFYNGRPIGAYMQPKGRTSTVDFWREGIVTRGVLYDVPRLRGAAHVEPGSPVHGWELQAAAEKQGVEPRPGDAVLIRSGRDPLLAAQPEVRVPFPAGVHASALEFLHAREAALLVWDLLEAPIVDQGIPNPLPIEIPVHVHCIAIPYMGMGLLDNAQLEELAQTCAAVAGSSSSWWRRS